MHDYEHSTKTGFIESKWTLMPDLIPNNSMSRNAKRTLTYPGLKEDAITSLGFSPILPSSAASEFRRTIWS